MPIVNLEIQEHIDGSIPTISTADIFDGLIRTGAGIEVFSEKGQEFLAVSPEIRLAGIYGRRYLVDAPALFDSKRLKSRIVGRNGEKFEIIAEFDIPTPGFDPADEEMVEVRTVIAGNIF